MAELTRLSELSKKKENEDMKLGGGPVGESKGELEGGQTEKL